MTRGTALVGTVLRGLRARALLSAGSVLLTALAIGSAVLGPIFQQAVTNSYLVTRLDEAPNNLTGLTWRFRPDRTVQGAPEEAVRRAVAAVRRDETGPFAAPTTTLETARVPALGGIAILLATDVGDGACAHLDVEGACPERPGEVHPGTEQHPAPMAVGEPAHPQPHEQPPHRERERRMP